MRSNFLIGFLVAALLTAIQVNAESKEPDRIVVIGSASVEVPADRVIITIHLSFSDSTDGKTAFRRHKVAEEKLVSFLHSFSIPDSMITYTLLKITTSTQFGWSHMSTSVHTTNQTIRVVLADFDRYSEFVLGLIGDGFANFDQQFQSSKSMDAQKHAVQMAVQQAKAKAELIASAAGRRIKKIAKISDTDETEPTFGRYYVKGAAITSFTTTVRELVGIPQTVSIEKQVKIVFDLAD